MKVKAKLTIAFTGLIMIFVLFSLGANLYNLNKAVEALRSDENAKGSSGGVESINLLKSDLEEKIAHIEGRLPEEDLRQFIAVTRLEINRIEDLLSKVEGLETIFGKITDMEISNGITLNVKVVRLDDDGGYQDTSENISIPLAEDFTPYMVSELTLVPVSKNDFIEVVKDNLRKGFVEGFTFKLIDGKAVHIYQGI